MTSDLTPRQRSVLDFIVAFQQEHRMAPTVREICAHLGLSGPAGIHRILGVLKEKGFLLKAMGNKAESLSCFVKSLHVYRYLDALQPDLLSWDRMNKINLLREEIESAGAR